MGITRDTSAVALIDGQPYYYDVCAKKRDTYNENGTFDYIGAGVIHSFYGAPQNSTRRKHFWRRKDRTILHPEETT